VASILLALAACAGLIWGGAVGDAAWGWLVALGLLAFAAADLGLFATLPRRGLSFGAVQPPLLGLALFRWLVVLVSAPLGAWWPLPTLLAVAAVQSLIWALMVYGTVIEPFRLQVSRVAIPHEKSSNPGRPLRIVHLSDLHVERLTRRERNLPAIVAALAPDLIVLTGDFLSTSYNRDPRALADLRATLEKLSAPAGLYAVWGTAEVDRPDLLRPMLESLGIVVLEDRAQEVRFGAHRLWLMGLTCSRDLATDGARLQSLMTRAPDQALNLLLYHTPDLMPQASALGVDLYLAGHTHGGQWRIPGLGAVLTSSRYWKRYEAGHYCEAKTHLYVSRGLGMEGFGAPRARFFCRPEVVLVTLCPERNGE
jgi:predicted MPP superfamily phosphohydrolase